MPARSRAAHMSTGYKQAVETRKERMDREVIELLNEIRIVLPGIQVLFGFLLLLPFQQSFGEMSELDRSLYFVALVASATGGVLLIAPSTYHRIQFRNRDKERLLRTSNVLILVGTAALGLAIATAMFLIADIIYGELVGVVVGAIAAVVVAGMWYGLPLSRKVQDGDAGEGTPPTSSSHQ